MKSLASIPVKCSIAFLGLLLTMVIFADFIAHNSPIITKTGKQVTFFSTKNDSATSIQVFAPIKHKGDLDLNNTLVRPFKQSNHLLGTDHLGRDILAGMIHGSRTSVGISLVAICTAAIIGLLLGGLAGFNGDHGFSSTLVNILFWILMITTAYYFLYVSENKWFPLLVVTTLLVYGSRILSKKHSIKRINIPIDLFVLKLIEIFSAIPSYFLVLVLMAFVQPDWLTFAIIIGATSWVGIAKLVRAEMIRIRTLGYIESAKALGLSKTRIFFRHALPNALGPLPYAMTFGIAAIVTMESTLSYFGIGLPDDSLSWGNFVSGFKHNSSAWWVALFPGLMISCTIISLHVVGKWMDAKFNPRIQVDGE